ncbi:MAG: response regulator transcription factor [Bacteroidota bacterium]
MKIIIVDDSKVMRERIINMISPIHGVDISAEARSSGEAIELLEKLKPDVMILDIRMPDGCGLEVLKYTQEKQIPVVKIVITNYPLIQYRKKCMELGSDFFYDKSTEFEEVYKVIEKLNLSNTGI